MATRKRTEPGTPAVAAPDLAEIYRQLVQANVKARADVVPPGWHTVKHFVESTGRSRRAISEVLKTAVECGTTEEKKFRILSGSTVIPVNHYRVKQDKSSFRGSKKE